MKFAKGNSNITDADKIKELIHITENLNHNKDMDALLDNILYEARKFTNADAGSIFLVDGEYLKFSYFQNDTLTAKDQVNKKYLYTNSSLKINDSSIAGYVALSGKPLILDDVYNLKNGLSYSFNSAFDEKSGYRTGSMLSIPLITSREKVIGVMQIINAMASNEKVIPFTEDDAMFVSFFGNNASVAIERARNTREIILRMIKMAELRDPKETGAHVNRVGSYAIEIYQRWAFKQGIDNNVIRRYKDTLRMSAMLHDVGKVAISDTILKKPARLTSEEYDVMKTHCQHGMNLFEDPVSDFDLMSAEIAMTHHEKWDGSGYPEGLKGEEIPLSGRIVALADVFDALISKRVYKDAWPEEKVLELLKEEAGKHFDPSLVEAFLEIYDIVRAIRDKYSE